ncbi:prepilin peptidase [Branchiibius cervicis]|uniref:Prepilin peptidase n=1 Tax=Branchiibius cervicis TaxID=908252 RepID=A0ABW2AVG9_9MICO
MTASIAIVGLAGMVGGLLAGLFLTPRLTTLAHRYDDEHQLRTVTFRWVPAAMAIAAALVGAAQTFVGGVVQGIVYAALTVPLIVLAAIDVDVHRLPDRWTRPTFVAALIGLTIVSAVRGEWKSLLTAVLCALATGLFYLVIALIAGGQGFGLGDVKLSPTLGLMLGFNGVAQAVLGVFAGFLSGGVLAVILILFAGATRKTAISFGPHMILGALLVLALPLIGAVAQH